jgi:hypothetical protein
MKFRTWMLVSGVVLVAACASSLLKKDVHVVSVKGNVCANCYWGMECGAISTLEVVQMGLSNSNPGYTGDSYIQFACDNGRTELGVLWTKGPCNQTGGLAGEALNERFKGIMGKEECLFGR